MIDEATALAELRAKLGDRVWRLNNLYKIKDKEGNVVPFVLNRAQRKLMKRLHHRNLILKARQMGFSTFVQLFMLDACLFNSNLSAGVVAHNREAAEDIFKNKIKFAFEKLPAALQEELAPTEDSVRTMTFANGSSITVGTSLRSGTFQMVHISEYGKIAAATPMKAEEIKTGTFETVPRSGLLVVESTAEGNSGAFYDLVVEARKLQDAGKELDPLQFRFHFFPWWEQREYVADPAHAVIYPSLQQYFRDLELKHGIKLTDEQKAWYALKESSLGRDMMHREYPSHPDEAFQATIQGAYYTEQFRYLRENGRITKVPHNPNLPVITAWDFGVSDDTAIWFLQVVGLEVRVIDFYVNNGYGLEHYAQHLRKLAEERKYSYSRHLGPHDIAARGRWIVKTGLEIAAENGLHFEVVDAVVKNSTLHAIEPVRRFLTHCWFDEERCAEGIRALENYRRAWDERLGCFKDEPIHDWASHPAKAFEVAARANLFGAESSMARPVVKRPIA